MTDELIHEYQDKHTKLLPGEADDIITEYDRIKSGYTDKYGIGVANVDCCYRINNSSIRSNRKKWNPLSVCGKVQKLNPCKLGFVQHYQCVIDQTVDQNNILTISHVCGNKLCINGRHMRIESQSINTNRTICHNKLIQFETEFRKNNAVNTKGKLIVENIMTAKGLNQGDDNYYICNHDPICLIMTGRL